MNWDQARARMREVLGVEGIRRCVSVGARQLLFERCRNVEARRVLEIGTYTGVSAAAMALSGAHVVTVDVADVNANDGYWATDDYAPHLRPRELMERLGVADRVEFVHRSSDEYFAFRQILRAKKLPLFDLAFIDGGHDAARYGDGDVTYREIKACLNVVRPDGQIILDDVFPDDEPIEPGGFHVPGPWRALVRVCQENNDLLRYCGMIQRLPDGSQTRMAEIRVP